MKLLRFIPLLLAASLFADEATVIFTPRLATYGPLTNVQITIRPLSVPASDGVGEMSVNAITNHTGTSTNWSTNLYTPGSYLITYFTRGSPSQPLYRTEFTNTFPNTNGTIYSRDYISASIYTEGSVAYSQAAANSRFALRTNAIQGVYTNGVPMATRGITNINFVGATGMVSGATAIIGGFSGGGGSGDSGGTNARQFGSLNLTNWSLIPTGEMANVVAVNYLTNWANSISNYVDTASSNRVRVVGGVGGITVSQSGSGGVQTWTINDDDVGSGGSDAGGTNARQFGTLNLTNWSNIPTGAMANVPAADALTNAINTASNRSWLADSWNTNRVNAAVTNNHTERLAFNTSLSVVGFTNMGSFYATDSSFAGTDAVIKKLGSGSQVVSSSLTVSGASNLAGIHNLTAAATIAANAAEITRLKRGWAWQGFDTNQTLDWAGTNHVILQPSNTVTLAFANTPSAGSLAQELRLEIYNSNASSATVVFPAAVDWGSNASPVYLPGTNHYIFRFNGTNLYGFSGQVLTTGTGETNVLSVSPALVTPTINGQTIASGTPILTNANAFQPASDVLTNLAGTRALTNIVSLGESNATVKPVFLHVSNDVVKTFGIEQGTNAVLYMTPTSIVFNASSAGGGGAATGMTNAINLRMMGAVGDGTTDDTAAMNAAIAKAGSPATNAVYAPAGTYNVDVLSHLPANFVLIGDGMGLTKFTLRTKTNDSVMFTATNYGIRFEGISVFGTNGNFTTGVPFSSTGMIHSALGGAAVTACRFDGWRNGLVTRGSADTGTRPNQGIYSLNVITNCLYGLLVGDVVNSGEYVTFANNRIHNCYVNAQILGAGNVTFGPGNTITDGTLANLYHGGAASVAKGNSHISGNSLNHGDIYFAYTGAGGAGVQFSDNMVQGGNRIIYDATLGNISKVLVKNNHLGITYVYIDTSSGNTISSCYFTDNTLWTSVLRLGYTNQNQVMFWNNWDGVNSRQVWEGPQKPTSKVSFSTNYTAQLNDMVLFCEGTNQVITLPNATNEVQQSSPGLGAVIQGPIGKWFDVISINPNGSVILTNANGVQTVNGNLSYKIPATNKFRVYCDGANWW